VHFKLYFIQGRRTDISGTYSEEWLCPAFILPFQWNSSRVTVSCHCDIRPSSTLGSLSFCSTTSTSSNWHLLFLSL